MAVAVATRPPNDKAASLLSRIGKPQKSPDRVLIFGVEGCGKTTFAADSGAVFICAEKGIEDIRPKPDSFPQASSLDEIISYVDALRDGEHSYKALAIDSLDWLDGLVKKQVCAKNGMSAKEFDEYGRGHNIAIDDWRRLIVALEQMQERRDIEVILVAHAEIKTFTNPTGADYMRWTPKLSGKLANGLFKEWARSVLFASHEHMVQAKDEKRPGKGTSTGNRVIHTQWNAAYDAKNRYDLPPILPLSYAAYVEAREKREVAPPETLANEARALVASIDPNIETRGKMTASIEEAFTQGDAPRLARIVDSLRTVLAQKEEA